MERIVNMIKEAGMFFLATMEGDQPRVRPFGELLYEQGRLYMNTGNMKAVYHQLKQCPKIELCAFVKGKWLRLSANAIEQESEELKQAMLTAQPSVAKLYQGKEDELVIFELTDVKARICGFQKDEWIVGA